jgi:cobalt-zinc-cadmium efflux system outer membrane protein
MLTVCSGFTQINDSIRITLQKADSTFIARNLMLLAEKYNISVAKALQSQARLFDNPNIYFEQSIYNQYSKKYFPTQTRYSDGSLGQNQTNVTQLISIAGRRNKRLNVAKYNTAIAQSQFEDLLRSLLYELNTNFYDLHFNLKANAIYVQQMSGIEKNINEFKQQYEKGNVALSEYLRLRSYLTNLKSEQTQVLTLIYGANKNLHVLLNDTSNAMMLPIVDEGSIDDLKTDDLVLSKLIDTAYANRPDVKIQEYLYKQENANLSLQKANGIPDLTLGGTYDRNGSYIPNYYGVGVGFQVPIFNRNQGNINASKLRLKQLEFDQRNYRVNVQQDVISAYNLLVQIKETYRTFDTESQKSMYQMLGNLLDNYRKRNIGIVEFIDFYDSFKTNIIQTYQIQNQLLNATENINYEVGKKIIK